MKVIFCAVDESWHDSRDDGNDGCAAASGHDCNGHGDDDEENSDDDDDERDIYIYN